MSVEVLDGATILNFVEDKEAFHVSICDRFDYLNADRDGLLSYTEMLRELQSLRVLEAHFGIDVKTDPSELAKVYGSLFDQFDHDFNGTVDLEEFKAETMMMIDDCLPWRVGSESCRFKWCWKRTASLRKQSIESLRKLLLKYYVREPE